MGFHDRMMSHLEADAAWHSAIYNAERADLAEAEVRSLQREQDDLRAQLRRRTYNLVPSYEPKRRRAIRP